MWASGGERLFGWPQEQALLSPMALLTSSPGSGRLVKAAGPGTVTGDTWPRDESHHQSLKHSLGSQLPGMPSTELKTLCAKYVWGGGNGQEREM